MRKAGVTACLVTMGLGQPSKATAEEVRRVDVDIPTSFARAAKQSGCVRHLSLLSAVGADINAKPSRLTGTAAGGGLYCNAKGQVCGHAWCFDHDLVLLALERRATVHDSGATEAGGDRQCRVNGSIQTRAVAAGFCAPDNDRLCNGLV